MKALAGGELSSITELISGGRHAAYARIQEEMRSHGAQGVTGVSSEIIFHGGNIEFLSIGSSVHVRDSETLRGESFSTSNNAQELYAQVDAGYRPVRFVFGNVAYSIGISRGIMGSLKSLVRGEIREFSNIFNKTRHLALERIVAEAKQTGANAVVGINTTILPVIGMGGVQEMLMIGTASYHEGLGLKAGEVVTSDLTAPEMWSLANMGYAPVSLVLGTSVYSLGLLGGITSFFKSFVRGEISELTKMIYDARENSLALLKAQAEAVGADEVVGTKTYIYQLGGGLIEFLVIGTAVKKIPGLGTASDTLIPQAIVSDRDTFINSIDTDTSVSLNTSNATNGGSANAGAYLGIGGILIAGIYFIIKVLAVIFASA